MASEVWQRGPVPGFDPWLMPVVHSLLQVQEDMEALAADIGTDKLWIRPMGAASIGFHLRHIAGSTDRLLTYARGKGLSGEQLASARREADETPPLDVVTGELRSAISRALEQLRATPYASLLVERKVGRAGLPSTTLGLLFHAAEHATRHAGQAITTAKILGGLTT